MPLFRYTEGAYSNVRVEIVQLDPGQNRFLIFSVGESTLLEAWVDPGTLSAEGHLNQIMLDALKAVLKALNSA